MVSAFRKMILTCAVFFVTARAHAADDPRKAQAEASFQEGIRLHDQGRSAEALMQFEQAYAIYPSPNTRINVAREEQLLGRSIDALRHYRDALRTSLLHPDVAAGVTQHVRELESHLGRMVLEGPAGLVVKVGDRDHVLPLSEAIEVEPGAIVVRGLYGSMRYHGTAVARAGEVVTVEMHVEASAVSRERPEPHTEPDTAVRDIVTGSVMGLGLVGIATGTVLALKAESQVGDARRVAATQPCTTRALSSCQRYEALLHEIRFTRETAKVSLALGGGLIAASAAGFVLWPNAKVRPVVTGRTVGLRGEF